MLNAHVFGCGAAGNKAAIALIDAGFNKENVTLINSTVRDIPEAYKDSAVIFSPKGTNGGCGKERSIGKEMFLNSMKYGTLSPEALVNPADNFVVIVGSTEGGSGSASVPILAKYISEVMNMPTIVCLFFGFEDDIRGMQNTIELCQELSDNYGVMSISNKKCMTGRMNKIDAEKEANAEFVRRVRLLMGTDIHESEQNIDATDLIKLISTTGYMDCGIVNLNDCNTVSKTIDTIDSYIGSSVSLEPATKSAKRIGIIHSIQEKNKSNIDLTFSSFKNAYGIPYEIFSHLQYIDGTSTVSYIASGMDLPLDTIKRLYDSYIESLEKANKDKDSFFDTVGAMEHDDSLDMLNKANRINMPTEKAKNDFFTSFGLGDKNTTDKRVTSPKVSVITKDSSKEY